MAKRSPEPQDVVVVGADVVVVETEAPAAAPAGPRPCVELTAGMARYLLAILDLSEADQRLSQSALSRRLGVSAPTTSEAVGRLRGLGLVEPDTVALTGAGTSAALVLRSRRLAARDLARDVLGIPDADVDAEAERLAFSASPLLGRGLVAWRARRQHG
ncbi:MAG: metal-dependent transcriptional regulator [Solirubrobacterales bacterium]|nr:metal-dependent transcriptional regulator [Solirubrobacterales bacterium]